MAEIGEVAVEEETMSNNVVETCIYKVPDWLKYHVCDNGNDRTLYEPEIISFGPYHWGNPRVTEMNKHKWRCLEIMLKRKDQHLDQYLDEMRKMENKVRACYQGPIEEIDSNAFVEMLVLDGCFMLEFLRFIKLGLMDSEYDNDPVFSKINIMQVIAYDMIKLENQLPLMVLEKLFSLQYERQRMENKKHIAKLVLRLLSPLSWITNQIHTEEQLRAMRNAVAGDPDNLMLHCLDIFRSALLYNSSEHQILVDGPDYSSSDWEGDQNNDTGDQNNDTSVQIQTNVSNDISSEVGLSGRPPIELPHASTSILNIARLCCLDPSNSNEQGGQNNGQENRAYSTMIMSCVAELMEGGVKFRMRNNQLLWDIKFNKRHGFLEIPAIKIDCSTKIAFLNLIAYEQCHLRPFWVMPITSYVAFMSSLVKSASDVSHLNQARIIDNQLGSDAEVANLFNGLVKMALVDWEETELLELSVELNRYCTHRRHRWCANLEHDYLKNPWVIISIVAALILFLLTIVQTFYAVLAYHKPPKSN